MDKCSQAVDGGGVDGGGGVLPCYSRLFGMDRIEQSARHFRRPGLDVRHAGNKRNAFPHQESPFFFKHCMISVDGLWFCRERY